MRDRLGKLELLLPHENEEKSAKDFSEWVKTRDAGFRREHLIPENNGLLTLQRFEDFVVGPRELDTEAPEESLPSRAATGRRGSNEVMKVCEICE